MTDLPTEITIKLENLEEAVCLWHLLNMPTCESIESYAKRKKISIRALGETQCGLWLEINRALEARGHKSPFEKFNPNYYPDRPMDKLETEELLNKTKELKP